MNARRGRAGGSASVGRADLSSHRRAAARRTPHQDAGRLSLSADKQTKTGITNTDVYYGE